MFLAIGGDFGLGQEADDRGQPVRGGDEERVRRIEGHAPPVEPSDVARDDERAAQARRREDSLVAQPRDLAAAPLAIGLGDAPGLVCAEPLRREGRRQARQGLRGRRLLARHVALRRRLLRHREERLAGQAVEQEQVSGLGPHGHRGDRAIATLHREERGRCRHVVVPEVVVHGLEVPGELPGGRLQGDHRVGVTVVALAQAAVVVGTRASRGHEDEMPLGIDHDA
jgi:hypothetical protein